MTATSEHIIRAARVMRAEDDPLAKDPSRTLFVASTDEMDRYRTRIAQDWLDGGRIAAWDANPVIMLMHDYGTLPVGLGVDRRVETLPDGRRALMIEVAWDMDDEAAAKLAGKYARGVMRAGSVGFRTGKVTALSALPKDHPWCSEDGELLEDNELREFSAVAIPGNASALAKARFGQAAWLADGLLQSAPPDLVPELMRAMQTEEIRRLIIEIAGDHQRSTIEAASAEARRHPLSWLYKR